MCLRKQCFVDNQILINSYSYKHYDALKKLLTFSKTCNLTLHFVILRIFCAKISLLVHE